MLHKQLLIDADWVIADLIHALQKQIQGNPSPEEYLSAVGDARHTQSRLRTELMQRYGVTAFGVRGAIKRGEIIE